MLEDRLREFQKTLALECDLLPEGILDGRLFFRKAMPSDDYVAWETKIPKELRDALPIWTCQIMPPKDGQLRPEDIVFYRTN